MKAKNLCRYGLFLGSIFIIMLFFVQHNVDAAYVYHLSDKNKENSKYEPVYGGDFGSKASVSVDLDGDRKNEVVSVVREYKHLSSAQYAYLEINGRKMMTIGGTPDGNNPEDFDVNIIDIYTKDKYKEIYIGRARELGGYFMGTRAYNSLSYGSITIYRYLDNRLKAFCSAKFDIESKVTKAGNALGKFCGTDGNGNIYIETYLNEYFPFKFMDVKLCYHIKKGKLLLNTKKTYTENRHTKTARKAKTKMIVYKSKSMKKNKQLYKIKKGQYFYIYKVKFGPKITALQVQKKGKRKGWVFVKTYTFQLGMSDPILERQGKVFEAKLQFDGI